ncbi:MAG: PAS domain S-box protein [Ignavibacteria bacterium]
MKSNYNLNNKFYDRMTELEKTLPLEKFIPSVLMVFLLCLFILSIITYSNIGQYRKEIESVEYANNVLKMIDNINLHSIELSVARSNSIITDPDQKYFEEIDSLISVYRGEMFNLKKLRNDINDQYELLKRIDSLSEENITLVKKTSANFINKIDSVDLQTDDLQSRDTKLIQSNLDEIRSSCGLLKIKEIDLLHIRSGAALRTNEVIQTFIIGMGMFSFIIIGLSIYISTRLIRNKNEAQLLLRQSYDELEDKVEERTIQLKKSNEDLEQEIIFREKTEMTLRESEHRFRELADSAPVLIWMAGLDRQCTYFNKVWLEFTGKTIDQEVGGGWTNGVHEKDLKKCMIIYSEAFEKRESFEMEYRLKNYKGEYKWLLVNGIPRYEENIFVGYIGCCIDIDERKNNDTFLKIQYEVSKTLAESKTINEALKRVLDIICREINWHSGLIWSVEKESFKVSNTWNEHEKDDLKYADLYKDFHSLPISKGIPGEIHKEKTSRWVKDISLNKNFIRKDAAQTLGWSSGLAIPITNGKDVISIIECFNRDNIEESPMLLEVLESVGRQIGNFMERKKAEDKLISSYANLEENVKERTNELASTLSRLINEMEAKEKIQAKIKLFAHAIKDVQESVYITDLHNKTIYVNDAFEKSFGYFESDILGKEIPLIKSDFIPVSIRNEIMKETIRKGWKGNISIKTRDQTPFHVFLSTSLVTNDEGKAEAIVGVCRDITDIKKSEEIINKRNNLLKLLNEIILATNKSKSLKEAIQFVINKVCQYNKWNIGHCYLKNGDKIESSKIWNDDFEKDFILLKNITEDPNFDVGNEVGNEILNKPHTVSVLFSDLKGDGRERIKAINSLNIKTGIWIPILKQDELVGILEFLKTGEEILDEDILEFMNNIGLELGRLSEQLDYIEKIRNREALLSEAQHIAKLGSWEWDVTNNILNWSPELYSIYELDNKTYTPSFESYMQYVHPDDREYVNDIIQNAFKTKDKFNFYHRIITATGKLKISKSQGEVFTNESGEVVRMFGTGLDITEIREAEDKIRKSEVQLRQMNEKLIEAQKELIHNEKLAALGRFSSGVAHEIRNPLANIMSLSQMIMKTELNEKNQKRLKYILTNSEIANNIIKSLLNFASPAELTFTKNNLNKILENILESVEARCNESNVIIEKDIDNNLPPLYSDKLKLENAFMNFVSNSIDSMFHGGKLTIKVKENEAKDEIKIDITDTGVGIPPENIDKILEPFFTTKDEGIGLGMGLAYQTIKQHFGIFNIESVEDQGTHIEIKLPIKN